MGKITFTLYLITDRKLFDDEERFFIAVEEALKGGCRAVQLREKDLSIRRLFDMAYRMKGLTEKYRAELFINDRADVALAVGADGVHLGSSGMPVPAVRRIIGGDMRIGVSVHSSGEVSRAAEEGADFITLGPIFETPSKMQYGAPLGTDLLRSAVEKKTVPVFAIGGIREDRIKEVMDAGADGIALISGILASKDPGKTTKEYMRLLQ